MATRSRFQTALPALLLGLSAGFATQATAQDPANVNAAPAADPARVGGQAYAAPFRGHASPARAPRPETMQRLQRAQDLQRRLAAQLGDGQALSPDQRIDMQQLLKRSSGLIDESWNKLGRRTANVAPDVPQSTQATADALAFDSLASLQQDPRVREGAQQAREAMDAMQRTLLPMLQELRDDIDAELRGAANRSR